jgi:UDP-N-acetylglucosamine 1-carboxyvinyltransferase
LSYPSVGASESCIFLGIYSKGINIIYNIAIEPEILELIFILRNMGAIIIINKKRQVIIHGIKKLIGISFELIKDRIESFSWACLNYLSQGETKISINFNLLQNYFQYIDKTHLYYYRSSIIFIKNSYITPKKLETNVYPYFATDLQQIICILLTSIQGISIMHETVYENRLKYIRILKKLGLKVKVLNICLGKYCQYQNKNIYHTILIYGANRNINISKLNSQDIRESFAFLMLSIYGKSQNLNNAIHIERGYGNIINRLINTNLQIKRYNSKNII